MGVCRIQAAGRYVKGLEFSLLRRPDGHFLRLPVSLRGMNRRDAISLDARVLDVGGAGRRPRSSEEKVREGVVKLYLPFVQVHWSAAVHIFHPVLRWHTCR